MYQGKRALTALILAGTLAGTAHAYVPPEFHPENNEELQLETAAGAGSGALLGGLAGGPFGAVAGGIFGSFIGERLADARGREEQQLGELQQAQQESTRLRQQLLSARAEMAQLQRRAQLAQDQQMKQQIAGELSLDVLFRTGSGELEPRARQRVTELARLLEGFPQLDIALAGHADRRGADTRNQRLSEHRAQAVKEALVGAGIPASRIRTRAYGASQAKAEPGDIDGLALDRRVDVTLTPAQAHYATTADAR